MELHEEAASYNALSDLDVLHLIERLRLGIRFNQFTEMTKRFPFDLGEWSRFLHLSDRTMQRYKKEQKTFEPIHAEKIAEITLLYRTGAQVLGSPENFNLWLDSPNLALGGKAPKELLDSTFGIGMVRDELARIEHGILA